MRGRVEFVDYGDSNQILSGHGWDHGMQAALSERFPMWATGLTTQQNAGQGYLWGPLTGQIGEYTGAPADVGKFLDKGTGELNPFRYSYVADGNTSASGDQCGMSLGVGCPIDVTAALEFDVHWAGFTSGAGGFRILVRREQSPFTAIANAATISTNTGSFAMNRSTVAIAANAGRAGWALGGRPKIPGSASITGPYFGTYYRFRRPDRTAGWAYSTHNFRGGQSTRTAAVDIQQASDETLTHYFGTLRADQGLGQKTIAIGICQGLNDRNETLTSVGPGAYTDGDSPEAFADNHWAIVNRILYIWNLNGWDISELWWILKPCFPVSTPDDAKLLSYRAKLKTEFAGLNQSMVIDLEKLITADQMLALGLFASGGSDRNHLSSGDAYTYLCRIIVDEMMRNAFTVAA